MDIDGLGIRPVVPGEHDALIRFWTGHFGGWYDCFARMLMQPWYRHENCLVAVEGDEIVASVMTERRTFEWRGVPVVCGAISQVATAERWRRKGVATELLRRSIEAIESDKAAFSALMTDVPSLFRRLGWETVNSPRFRLPVSDYRGVAEVEEIGLTPLPAVVPRIYEDSSRRELYFPRPRVYFQTYVGWTWTSDRQGAEALIAPDEAGYAIVGLRGKEEVYVEEAFSDGAATELMLIRAAANWAARRGRTTLTFGFMPQHLNLSYLIGAERFELAPYVYMIRRMAMREKAYAELKNSLESGTSVLWDADEF